MSDMSSRPRRASTVHSHCVAKVPRERIDLLAVEADHCPQVLMRVLGLIAQRGYVPLTISAQRAEDSLVLEVALDSLGEQASAVLVEKVRAIVMVRNAEMHVAGYQAQEVPRRAAKV